MAYGVIHFFPGGTKKQYDATLAAVHPDRSTLPKGQIYHAAGASQDGWCVIAVHDTKESWEKFRKEILMPRLTEGVKGGFTSPPEEKTFDIYNLQSTKTAGQREMHP